MMSFWVDALVKGTALLIVIFGLAAVSGRWSAATRHQLWCFGLVGLLILPALSSVTPWHLRVLPPVEGVALGEILPTTAPNICAKRRRQSDAARRLPRARSRPAWVSSSSPMSSTVSIIPGMLTGAPERTLRRSGAAGSPKRRPSASPSRAICSSTASRRPSGKRPSRE